VAVQKLPLFAATTNEECMVRIAVLACLAGISALAACSSKNDASSRANSASSTASSSTTATNAPLTDENIIAKESAGDTAEVMIAQYASAHTTDNDVKSFAKLLIADHAKGKQEVDALTRKLSIIPQPRADDTTSAEVAHTINHLATLHGHDLDTAFVNHEVQDHQTDIADAQKAAAAAKNEDIKALVEKSIPELQKHLDVAQALQRKLSPDSTAVRSQ
jgi:putative membrane protein